MPTREETLPRMLKSKMENHLGATGLRVVPTGG